MSYSFDCKEFENIFSSKGEKKEALIERVLKAWGHEWASYLKHLLSQPKQLGYYRRLLKQKKDRHGVATKKFLLWMLKMDNPGAYKTDQLILLFITARLRTPLSKKFGGEGDPYKGLRWLLEEWKNQVEGTKRFDGLSIALTELEYHPMHIIWAIISHARRMRVGVSRRGKLGIDNEEKIEISRQLIQLAEYHLNRKDEVPKPDQFCEFPPCSFSTYLLGQKMLNESRIGNQKKAVELAKEVRDKLDKLESNKWKKGDFEWPKYLKWFTYYVEIRAASAEMNDDKRKEIKKELNDLANSIQEPKFEKYIKENLEERFKLVIPTKPDPRDGLSIRLFEIFQRWMDYDDNKGYEDKDSDEYAKFCWTRDRRVPEEGFPQMHKLLLGNKWNYEGGSPFGPFQRFSTANQMHASKRANYIMKEIELVRSFGRQPAGNLSCLMMELLFRELIYRLWYEVRKMQNDLEHRVDLKYARGLLRRLKHDIVQLRVFENDHHPDIDKSIDKLKQIKRETKPKALEKELRDLLDNLFSGIIGKQHWFLGIPYANDGDDFSLKTHAFSHVLEKSEPNMPI